MKRAVLIIVILAVLVMAGGVQAGKMSQTVFTAPRAADALRAAVNYLDTTSRRNPLEIDVLEPPTRDAHWVVVVTE